MFVSRRALKALSSIGLLAWFSYEMIRSPLLPLFAQHLGIPTAAIGFVVGASTITGIFLKFPAGVLSDLLPRRRLLLFGASVFAIAPFSYLIIESPAALIALRFLHGMATAVFAPVALATVASLFVDRRAESLSWYSSSTMAGGLLGPVLGGFLLHQSGFPASFCLAGGIGIAALLMTWWAAPTEGEDPHKSGAGAVSEIGPRLRRALQEVGGDVRIVITSATQAIQYMAIGTLQAFLPLYALSTGLNATQIGLLIGLQSAVTILAKPLLGRQADRMGKKPVILTGLILSAFTLGAVPHVVSFSPLLILSAGFGLGVALVTSSASALVADLCQERNYGSAMGLFGTIMDIGHAAGPILAGLLIASFDYAPAFGAVAACLLIAAGIFASRVHVNVVRYRDEI